VTGKPIAYWRGVVLCSGSSLICCDAGDEAMMVEELKRLLEASRRHPMSADEKEAQRRSFAYGNTAFENPLITREMVDDEAKKLAAEVNQRDKRRE
jgi:hypothetical protein